MDFTPVNSTIAGWAVKMIPWVLLLLGMGAIIASTKKANASSLAEGSMPLRGPYTPTTWEPLIIALGGDLPWKYVRKWIEIESGGRPCAVGKIGKLGPDGQPKEMGIFQLYNPDDLARFKITSTELRAYCRPNSENASRPLTNNEMRRQIETGIALINHCRTNASSDLRKVGANWDHNGRDYFALVKLQHGLPGISRSGIPAVTKALGHPPRSWQEFRTTLANVKLDPGTEAYRDSFDRILNNAEKAASVITPTGNV